MSWVPQSGTMHVGMTPDGWVWFRAAAAVQFAQGFANVEHARKLLSKAHDDEDGVPDGFQRGSWKVGDAMREGGFGWSVKFSTMRNTVNTEVLLARDVPASRAHAHVIIPDEGQVRDFLDRCQEAGRQVLEKIASIRTAAAVSLDIEHAEVDIVFAANCTDERIQQLQDAQDW